MSHFVMLVETETSDESELNDRMLPYHEYECTGIEAYLEFVPMDQEEFAKDFAEHGNGRNRKTFAEEYYGYEISDKNEVGRLTNPNAKWDWWVVGGRWSGFFPGGRDIVRKGDIDFDASIDAQKTEAGAKWDEAMKIIAGRRWLSFEQQRDLAEDVEEARKAYWNQTVVKDLNDKMKGDSFFFDPDQFRADRDTYVRDMSGGGLIPFGFLTIEDGWQEKAEMGWWGMTSDDQEDWAETFRKLMAKVPEGHTIWAVDCHI